MSRANKPVHPYDVVNKYHGGYLEDSTERVEGITLREHFAAQFLAALLTHPARSTDGLQECEIAVQYADALIEELSE